MELARHFRTALVGYGPAGLAVLLSAHRDGRLRRLLGQGLLILEQGTVLGAGSIGQYTINSDSTGDTFVDPLRRGDEAALRAILDTPVGQRIAEAGANAIPLRDAGELLGLIGEAMRGIIEECPQSRLCLGWKAESAQQMMDGRWLLSACGPNGETQTYSADRLILATGATQPRSRLECEHVAGVQVVTRWADRLMQSGEVVGPGGLERVNDLLGKKHKPRVAVLGGSTSAMAVSCALLTRLPGVRFGPGGVTLFHRRPLRVYYTSREDAFKDNYLDFGEDDLCPLTKRVYRLAGLRLDSRELLMSLLGLGGRPAEPRMNMYQLQTPDPEAICLIDRADLVIAAFGYRPNALPLFDQDGARISTFAETSASSPLVDEACRIIDAQGMPVGGVFGIGLAAGFVPRGKLGGEPSFSGQANGLWLWQTDVGAIVVDGVLKPVTQRMRTKHAALAHDRISAAHVRSLTVIEEVSGSQR